MIDLILESTWYGLPAFCANISASIFGGGRPVDLKKKFIDGRRLLGDHKTLQGTLAMLLVGLFIGFTQEAIFMRVNGTIVGFVLGFGTFIGDATGSFVKRRLDLKPGSRFFLIDNFDFILGALLFGSLIEPIPISHILFLIIVVPIFVILFNILGFKLGVKEVPH
jgi:CDP-2,3-bis-(O-geranylgeranyl)-sn-glycerol synthase